MGEEDGRGVGWTAVRDEFLGGIGMNIDSDGVVRVVLATLALVNTANAQDRDDLTLQEAAYRGSRGTVLRLLDRGADIDGRDGERMTALHRAARSCLAVGERRCRAVAAVLVDRGAEVDARDGTGRTPLHWAADRHAAGVVVDLLRHGADVLARDDEGRTPLHNAVGSGTFGAREIVVELLQRGADPDARDGGGRTPVQVADDRERTEVARLLRGWREVAVETALGDAAEVRVEVTAASVMRFRGAMTWDDPGPEDLAYIEATLFGPFFERGRSEVLTVRLVPDRGVLGPFGYEGWNSLWWWPRDDEPGDGYVDPWRALQRFSAGSTELYRGSRLLGRVENQESWVEMVGVSSSVRSGLLELHLVHVNPSSGGNVNEVVRYDSMTGRLEVLDFGRAYRGFEERLMTCTGEQRRWPEAPAMGSTVFFEPCRSNVEQVRAVYEAAAEVRGWGSGVVADRIATEPGAAVDVGCDACAEIDDATLSAGLAALRRRADGFGSSVSIERFASPAFEVVAVDYRAAGDSRPAFTLLLARRPAAPWRPIYGWERDGWRPPSGSVGGFVPEADSVVRLTVHAHTFGSREALLDIRARTLRVAEAP